MSYALPRDTFDLLLEAFGDRKKAETFARAIEASIEAVDEKAEALIDSRLEQQRATLYNDLRDELATKEFVRAENNRLRAEFNELRAEFNGLRSEFNELRAEFNELRGEVHQLALLVKVLLGLAIIGLTLLNPGFVQLMERLF